MSGSATRHTSHRSGSRSGGIMLAVAGTRIRSIAGGLAKPAIPKTPCHQDAGWLKRSLEGRYLTSRLPVPAAVEDAVVLIGRHFILPNKALEGDVWPRPHRRLVALHRDRNPSAVKERQAVVKNTLAGAARNGSTKLREHVESRIGVQHRLRVGDAEREVDGHGAIFTLNA